MVEASLAAPPSEGDGCWLELLPPAYSRPVSLITFRVAVVPKAAGSELLRLLQRASPLGLEFAHLKRVRPTLPPATAGSLEVLVCPADDDLPADVAAFLAERASSSPPAAAPTAAPSAAAVELPRLVDVPRYGALTRAQMVEYSVHWPLTFRIPALVPLELPAPRCAEYARLLRRAAEVGGGSSGCVIVDRDGRELAAAGDAVAPRGGRGHPLRHAVMVAIEAVAAAQKAAAEASERGVKRPREEYLCQDCEVVTTHEPCIMCSMALVHSRVRLVAYRARDLAFGGLGGALALHQCASLNHQFRVLRWDDEGGGAATDACR